MFTEQQAALQRADADRRMHQAGLRQHESQSKNVVRVFAWFQDNCHPILHDFALPPNSRTFKVTELVVCDLSLISDSNVVPFLKHYDDVEDVWVGFKVGQVFDAEAHQHRFFFKQQDVKHCRGFENHIGHTGTMHFHDNLSAEQSYVRDALSQKHVAALTQPPLIELPERSHSPSSSTGSTDCLVKNTLSQELIVISSNDEISSLPAPTVPSINPRKRPLPRSPEVILVLDSDEEVEKDAASKRRRVGWKGIKQEGTENGAVQIKLEKEVDAASSPLQPHRVCQPSVDTVCFSEDDAPKWPQHYYVCDVAKVFKKPPPGVSKKAAFCAHFPGLLFKKSTFYDNYNIWIRTPRDFRMKYSDYGHTPKGTWKHFLAARAKYLD